MTIGAKNFKKCNGTTYCEALEDRLQANHNKGFVYLEVLNLKKHEVAYGFVAYKRTAKDRGVVLNFCPFCGKKLYLARRVII